MEHLKNLIGAVLVTCMLFVLPQTCLGRGMGHSRKPQKTQYDTPAEREQAANREKALKARQEAIKQATERMKAAAQCIREISEEIREFQQAKQEALNEMVQEGSGVHTNPEYMEKPPKMYDHVPTADEVYRDMSPSARFEHSRTNISRLQGELEACQKEMKKAQEELNILQGK